MGEDLTLSISFSCESSFEVRLQDRIFLEVSSEALSFTSLPHFSSNLYLQFGVDGLQE